MISLRKANSGNVLEIKRLLFKTWVDTYSSIYSEEAIKQVTSEWHSRELLSKQINDSKNSFWVAKDGNKIVGMCNASLSKDGREVNIQRLHILPTYQRQGIGSMLTTRVIKKFPGAEKINLEVEKQNYKAQAFYKKQGFRKAGQKLFRVKEIAIDCLVLEKKI